MRINTVRSRRVKYEAFPFLRCIQVVVGRENEEGKKLILFENEIGILAKGSSGTTVCGVEILAELNILDPSNEEAIRILIFETHRVRLGIQCM